MRPVVIFTLLCIAPALLAEPLTRVEQVRALTPSQAREQLPVRLVGVITYIVPEDSHGFIADETGSVFFRADPNTTGIAVGDEVEIKGFTWGGSFSPSISGKFQESKREPEGVSLKKLGAAELPEPNTARFDQLKTGRWHDQFVIVKATVRECSASPGRGNRYFKLSLSGPDGGEIEAWGKKLDLGDPGIWIDREVWLRAVVAGGGDSSGQLSGAHLLIGDSAWLEPNDAILESVFQNHPLPLDRLRAYKPPTSHNDRVRVDGTISLVNPGEGFFISDGAQGIWVGTPQRSQFKVGDVVTIAGHLKGERLFDGIVRIKAHGPAPAPEMITDGDELSEGQLVSIEGKLRELRGERENRTLIVELHNGSLMKAGPARPQDGLKPGARLMVSGVAEGGQIWLRDDRDIAILESPPWLNPTRKRILIAGVGSVILAVLLWLYSLRTQVARQTKLIETKTVEATLIEERRRMARDLHDSLEQNLVGLHLQLDHLRDLLGEGPEKARQLAEGAVRMLGHCRDEARRSVFELKTETLQREGLPAALIQLADEHSHAGNQPKVTAEISGKSFRLDPTVEFQLLRCAQEAVANALKYAQAKSIEINLEFDARHVVLSVADDGVGFDPEKTKSQSEGGYGLQHLQERASRIHAELTMNSIKGTGSTISVKVPLKA